MTKLEKVFGKPQADLIRQFIIVEANNYKEYKNGDGELDAYGRHYVNGVLGHITRGIKTSFEHMLITSHGNSGIAIRTLELSPKKKWYDDISKVEVSLCTCGRLEHWGGIITKRIRLEE